MNRNRKLLIPKQEKPKIRNRHERDQRRERKVTAYAMAIIVLAILIGGIIGQIILIGGVVK